MQTLYFLGENKNKKDSAMAASPLWVSEELEYWDSNIRFTHIAATYSELVAISTQGQLHQWRWADAHPYQRADVSFKTDIYRFIWFLSTKCFRQLRNEVLIVVMCWTVCRSWYQLPPARQLARSDRGGAYSQHQRSWHPDICAHWLRARGYIPRRIYRYVTFLLLTLLYLYFLFLYHCTL